MRTGSISGLPGTQRNAPDRIRTCDLRFRRTGEGGSGEATAAPMRPGCNLELRALLTRLR